MADDQQRNTASAFPAPPPFFKNFTPENQAKLKELQRESNRVEDDGGDAPSQSLPPELVCLIPPKPPTEGQYRSFGDTWNIPDRLPTLNELNIPQLFPEPSDESYNVDRAQELRRLCKSLLLNYLELVGIMGMAPEEFEEKVYHLRIHLINIHQLINEYRPHQARETLISMMEEQLERSRQETAENRKACRKTRELLASLSSYNANGLLDDIAGDITTAPTDGLHNVTGKEKGPPANGEANGQAEKAPAGGDQGKDGASWEALQQAGLA
ncbi:Mediator of RNA polymerase II transcription subunit [Drechslerella dactyloides]|uniref:Mediator of RNA polymerase II transcription subunit 7 n=1 Tax=Drechslerella dactyloides TaxID=74499 RepID=A0AAD6NKA6_DREDA|nr:Mediator of RNA polymerase II transcription subunit [Drechslerella dactyloides]